MLSSSIIIPPINTRAFHRTRVLNFSHHSVNAVTPRAGIHVHHRLIFNEVYPSDRPCFIIQPLETHRIDGEDFQHHVKWRVLTAPIGCSRERKIVELSMKWMEWWDTESTPIS